MNTLRFKMICIAGLLVLAGTATAGVSGVKEDPEARKILVQEDARDEGDNRVTELDMILIDKNGNDRVRNLKAFNKYFGDDNYRLMFFKYPPDVKNTAFMIYDYDDEDRDDDQWLYLPALNKTKRVASTDRSKSFMGSDLNYADLSSRNLQDYDFCFHEQKETEINGHKVWVIYAHPRTKDVVDETGYKKSLLFIRQDIYYIVRAVLWESEGGYMKFLDVKNLQKIDGIWTTVEMVVIRKLGKKTIHKTILQYQNVKYNQDISADLFSGRAMEKGIR